jgi:CubicO group peptidase (beta-lactamase class C family)
MTVWRLDPDRDPAEVGVDPGPLDEIASRLEAGLETGKRLHGAQMAIFRRGVKVFDMGGGLARVRTEVPVTPETLFVMFSATKGLAALAMLMLYERNAFHYDEPVVKYWPEFARSIPEKSTVTIRHVMSHRGGFPLGPRGFRPEGWVDPEAVESAMEEVRLRHTPGERNAYHPMNFGHVVDALVRRIDGRNTGEFLREEVFEPLGLRDIYLGLPDDPALEDRVAWCYGELGLTSERVVKTNRDGSTELTSKAEELPARYADQPELATAFNRPEIHRAVLPAANGIGSARDLAGVYAVLAMGGRQGDVKLVSADGLRAATAPTNRRGDKDGTIGFPMRWATGFHLGDHGRGSTLETFGHAGVGGQIGFADPARELAVAFLCNGELDSSFLEWRFGLQSLAFEACID